MSISKNKKREILRNNVYIFGIGERSEKFIKDFLYVFNPPYVKWQIGNGIAQLSGKDWRPLIIMSEKYDQQAINRDCCEFGLTYGKDYFFADDFFELLNDDFLNDLQYFFEEHSVRNALIRLAHGYMARKGLLDEDDQLAKWTNIPLRVVDGRYNFRMYIYGVLEFFHALFSGNIINGYNHIKSEQGKLLFFLNSQDYLRFMKRHNDYKGKAVIYQDVKCLGILSNLFNATYYDNKQTDCSCVMPFGHIMINFGGVSNACSCPGGYLLLDSGNAVTQDLSSLWNSTLMSILRVSFINRSYSFCSRKKGGCEYLRTKNNDCQGLKRLNINSIDYPKDGVTLAIEEVCNLKCPSCRREHKTVNSEEMEYGIDVIVDKLKENGWLEKTNMVVIGGNGEVFLAKGYRRLMYETRGKRISMATNGTLLTPETFEPLRGNYKEIRMVVSVDATTEETYLKLRGGNFKKLMENMDYLSELRKSEEVSHVTVNLIVQRENYREMKDFILWAKKLGFDQVFLSEIDNWGTYTAEEFDEISMFDTAHNMKPELAEIVKDPIFNDPIVRKKWEGSL